MSEAASFSGSMDTWTDRSSSTVVTVKYRLPESCSM